MSQQETKKRRRKPVEKPPSGVEKRKEKKFGIHATFGIDLGFEENQTGDQLKDNKGEPIPKERDVTGFTEPGPETPDVDPGYVFPAEETKVLLLGLALKDRILLSGHTGTGKTSLVEQVAARLNYNVIKINFDGDISRADLIGEPRVIPNPQGSGSITEFQHGILPHAFKMPGTIIILDEWDAISGECAFVLQRPLQKDDGKLLILENGGELLPLHPQNAIIATANTTGQGDESGLYSHGTRVQNYAQLNRFGLTIKMQYLPPEKETAMIHKRYPDLTEAECKTLVRAVGQVREAYLNGELSAPLSPRDLINWADKYIRMGNPIRAAKYCFLNRMPEEDHVAAEQILQRSFAKE